MNAGLLMDPSRNEAPFQLNKFINEEVPAKAENPAASSRGMVKLKTLDMNQEIIMHESNQRM